MDKKNSMAYTGGIFSLAKAAGMALNTTLKPVNYKEKKTYVNKILVAWSISPWSGEKKVKLSNTTKSRESHKNSNEVLASIPLHFIENC